MEGANTASCGFSPPQQRQVTGDWLTEPYYLKLYNQKIGPHENALPQHPPTQSLRWRISFVMHTQPLSNNKLVKPGIYEIQSGVTSLFLNSVNQAVYNGWYDDALTLEKHPNRRGKVRNHWRWFRSAH